MTLIELINDLGAATAAGELPWSSVLTVLTQHGEHDAVIQLHGTRRSPSSVTVTVGKYVPPTGDSRTWVDSKDIQKVEGVERYYLFQASSDVHLAALSRLAQAILTHCADRQVSSSGFRWRPLNNPNWENVA